MKTITKKELQPWLVLMVLVCIIYIIIIGLLNDWHLFSFEAKKVLLFKNAKQAVLGLPTYIVTEKSYPIFLNTLFIPVVIFCIFLIYKKLSSHKDLIIGFLFGLILGFLIPIESFNYGVLGGLFYGFFIGIFIASISGLINGYGAGVFSDMYSVLSDGFGSGVSVGLLIAIGFSISASTSVILHVHGKVTFSVFITGIITVCVYIISITILTGIFSMAGIFIKYILHKKPV